MTIKDFYNWAFICGDWQIAYRKRTDKSDFYEDSFIKIPNTDRYWFADPMLFADNGNTYLLWKLLIKRHIREISDSLQFRTIRSLISNC